MIRQSFLAVAATLVTITSIQLWSADHLFAAGENQQPTSGSPIDPTSQRSEAVDSKHLIDSELLKFFNDAPRGGDINAQNLAMMNQGFITQSKSFQDPASANVKAFKKTIVSPSGNKINVFVYQPDDQQGRIRPGILHMHGGGFVAGSADMNEGFCKKMAYDLNAVVVSVDYRLATEAPFPEALEDSYAALLWMSRESKELGIDNSKLAVTGESAGGGLAAELAFLVRDRKEVSLVLQYLTQPMLDDRTGVTIDVSPYLGQYVWTRGSNQFGWSTYLHQPAGSASVPYPAVPARIENLQGLAPCFIVSGALDLLAVENLSYAERLASQGVPTGIHVYPGALHGFMNAASTELAKDYYEERKRVFQKAFAAPSRSPRVNLQESPAPFN